MKQIRENTISIVGLGKLGLPLLACFAARGFQTIGVDVQESVVEAVNAGSSPIVESELGETISQFKNNIRATRRHEEAIQETDITFIIVSTPSDPEGNFSNSYVESALESLAKSFKTSKKPYHLFVISSTVMPGSTEKRLIPLIEEHSGKKLNRDFGVCYVPDFVALGSVIHDFLNPDLVVIGESDAEAGDQLIPLYKKFCENSPVVSRMSIMSAEIAKVSLNVYITTKLSFANSLANVCERIPGADVDVITKAIGADKRISPYYFKGGLSFGGTCFPRDTKSFIRFAKEYGAHASLIQEVARVNTFQDEHLRELVLRNLPVGEKRRVSILGLAFKPKTPEITESPSIKLIEGLLKEDVEVAVYDPLAMHKTKELFDDKIMYVQSVEECLAESSFWIIVTPDEEFKEINERFHKGDSLVVLDCWRILDPEKFSSGNVKYLRWGYYGKN